MDGGDSLNNPQIYSIDHKIHKFSTRTYLFPNFMNSNPGIHHLICKKLESLDIREEIPELIQIMLYHSDDVVSFPIYRLLLYKAKKSLFFRITLFLGLKSVLRSAEENKASFCYFLCCDLFDISRSIQKEKLGCFNIKLQIQTEIKEKTFKKSIKYRECQLS